MKKRPPHTSAPAPLPFIKWAGGKRGIVDQIRTRMPTLFTHYFEPFIGGGALFFSQEPSHATILDKNEELINVYVMVQKDVTGLMQILDTHAQAHNHDYYYEVRAQHPKDLLPLQRAARFIYLNKTCYNGLYRVNKQGLFNVPYGRYKTVKLYDAHNLHQCHALLQKTTILCGDFAQITPKKDDFVYFDPPYYETFTQYTQESFGPQEQTRLRDFCQELNTKGVHFILSNSHNEFICDLYKDFRIDVIQAPRFISCHGHARGKTQEVIISNV